MTTPLDAALQMARPGAVANVDYFVVADGTWSWVGPNAPSQAEVDAQILPAAKTQRIDAINAECRARLIARFGPAEEQVSRSVGVYGAAEQAALKIGIELMVDAANAAQNAILAAADLAAVEAVTVTWPVI